MNTSHIQWGISGIYQITHKINGKIYVGSGVNIKSRISNHISYFKKGKHHNKPLQNAWNKYGENVFEVSVLEVVADKNYLIETEQKWIDLLKPFEREIGYNILRKAQSTLRQPKACSVCNRLHKNTRKGKCHTCNEYLRRRGVDRPYIIDGRSEKVDHAKAIIPCCVKCIISFDVIKKTARNMCKKCYWEWHYETIERERRRLKKKKQGKLF